jgi:SAM-dependent methyltransferase
MRPGTLRSASPIRRVNNLGQIVWLFDGVEYPDACCHGDACSHIEDVASGYCQGTGIDVGAGAYPLGGAFPVRDLVHYIYRNGKQARRAEPLPGAACAYDLSCFVDESLDYVFSSHCLEHLDRPSEAIALWAEKLKPGGWMFLYLPHPEMALWRPGGAWVHDNHKWSPDFKTVALMLNRAGISVSVGNGLRDDFWSFHIAGRKR